MNTAQSILAGCLLLALPTASAHADDVKAKAPNDYLEHQVLNQIEALLPLSLKDSDIIQHAKVTWPTKEDGIAKRVVITKLDAETLHVSTKLHFTGEWNALNPTLPGWWFPVDQSFGLAFDIHVDCVARNYTVTAHHAVVTIGDKSKMSDEVTDLLESKLSGLVGKVDTAILEATTAFGIPSEIMCRSVSVSSSAGIDLSFEIGQCFDGDTKHVDCFSGQHGDGMDYTCKQHLWTMTKFDCKANANHDPNGPGNTTNPNHREP
jgi:hypothetical protein